MRRVGCSLCRVFFTNQWLIELFRTTCLLPLLMLVGILCTLDGRCWKQKEQSELWSSNLRVVRSSWPMSRRDI
jgi:hypothetical protein